MKHEDMHVFSRRLVFQSIAGISIACLAGFLTPLVATRGWLSALTGLSSMMTVLLSAYLFLEAALFRLLASYPSMEEGCAAIDDWLDRTGLRRKPSVVRGIGPRISGTSKIRSYAFVSAIGTTVFALLSIFWEGR